MSLQEIAARALLSADTEYTVAVASAFRAVDGGEPAEDVRLTLRAKGPTLVSGSPANANDHPRPLTPNARFELAHSPRLHLFLLHAPGSSWRP
jgi:hypothetical protein